MMMNFDSSGLDLRCRASVHRRPQLAGCCGSFSEVSRARRIQEPSQEAALRLLQEDLVDADDLENFYHKCGVSRLRALTNAIGQPLAETALEGMLALDDARARHAHIKNAPDFRGRRLGGIDAIS